MPVTRTSRNSVAVLRGLWRRGGGGRLFLLALLAGAAWLALVPLSSRVARATMGRFHLRGPFPLWALLQPLPSMYNFSNVATVRVAGEDEPRLQIWLNHYPLRVITYMARQELSEGPCELEIVTRYGATRLVTRCHTEPRDGVIHVRCEAVE